MTLEQMVALLSLIITSLILGILVGGISRHHIHIHWRHHS